MELHTKTIVDSTSKMKLFILEYLTLLFIELILSRKFWVIITKYTVYFEVIANISKDFLC